MAKARASSYSGWVVSLVLLSNLNCVAVVEDGRVGQGAAGRPGGAPVGGEKLLGPLPHYVLKHFGHVAAHKLKA